MSGVFFQNNILVSDEGEWKVFIIFFYEISHFPEPSEYSVKWVAILQKLEAKGSI